MHMLDLHIKGASIVDGSGRPAVVGDLGVREGSIVAIGEVEEDSRATIDADGLVACPGFVDPHTHYDAQLFWDPVASPSGQHGVTTVIGGNCSFGLAPLGTEDDADYARRLMAKVEGMPLDALEDGMPWDWTGFGSYLDRLEGRLGVNAGFLVGHSALRRMVMGGAANEQPASPGQRAAIERALAESLEAGALGLSLDISDYHSDADGRPVPARGADRQELLSLCEETGRHPGTSLGGIFSGVSTGFDADEGRLLAELSAVAGRPLNWNLLVVDATDPGRIERQMEPSRLARSLGGRVVALTMPVIVPMNMSFGTYCALNLLPGWGDVLNAPLEERVRLLRDPAVRRTMASHISGNDLGMFQRLVDFGSYRIGDTYSAANNGLTGRVVSDIAAERKADPFDTLIDVVLEDDLRTVLWPSATDDDDEHWRLRRELWDDPDILLGGSDAGAHLDRMCGGAYPSQFLADCLRGRRLLPLERAIHMLTDVPARLFGLRDRGRLEVGARADIVVFDPATVDAAPARLVPDLPGGSVRLTADAVGVRHVIVNGTPTFADGEATGALPGVALRSGRDTETVDTRTSG